MTLRASNRQLKAAQEKHRSERKAETQKKRRMMGQDSDNIDACHVNGVLENSRPEGGSAEPLLVRFFSSLGSFGPR